ncbi:hypothetical protein [Streptomyces sp. KS 21]|uniref:hypothetical protein n=1 Tax=Streptomyces sp. KS 21 TaxID=2485150 RepID=UPI001414EBE9|nr:hypothetical protein [Streptomyces sp. KS 21]
MRRQEGDGRAEVLGRLPNFAGKEVDLPAERGTTGLIRSAAGRLPSASRNLY